MLQKTRDRNLVIIVAANDLTEPGHQQTLYWFHYQICCLQSLFFHQRFLIIFSLSSLWRYWTSKILIRYILSSVCLRLSQISQLSVMQYMGLCVFSLPISLMMIVRICVLYLIIIIKSPLFRFRSWNNGIHWMSVYILQRMHFLKISGWDLTPIWKLIHLSAAIVNHTHHAQYFNSRCPDFIVWHVINCQNDVAWINLCMHPANERWCYSVTPSLIGRAHIQNDPWFGSTVQITPKWRNWFAEKNKNLMVLNHSIILKYHYSF